MRTLADREREERRKSRQDASEDLNTILNEIQRGAIQSLRAFVKYLKFLDERRRG